jgi:hypothetical protein
LFRCQFAVRCEDTNPGIDGSSVGKPNVVKAGDASYVAKALCDFVRFDRGRNGIRAKILPGVGLRLAKQTVLPKSLPKVTPVRIDEDALVIKIAPDVLSGGWAVQVPVCKIGNVLSVAAVQMRRQVILHGCSHPKAALSMVKPNPAKIANCVNGWSFGSYPTRDSTFRLALGKQKKSRSKAAKGFGNGEDRQTRKLFGPLSLLILLQA